MDKTYQPSEIESRLYQTWLEQDTFKLKPTRPHQKAFCMMLPPPNVTGDLHMGHAFEQTLMDILIRAHRMQGQNVLWQVGVDHAGIATQLVLENQLHQQGKTRYDLGRDAFVDAVWDWKKKSGGNIIQQMHRLGVAADWSRERFTLDPSLSHAVQTAFIQLYRNGLIYRKKRLVNWDPHFKTAISDLEVVHSEEPGFMYFLRYPIVNSRESLVVATTRPETLLGDAAVAVHPQDARYTHLIGKKIALPLTKRLIPIIADEKIDPLFGTGCVKITPAHDFNDHEIAQRHQLPQWIIFTLEGHLNQTVPEPYQGLERFAARKKILADLEAQGLYLEKKPHTLNIPRNERGNTILEPMLTDQWYVNMKPLAEPALQAVQRGEINLVPNEWKNTYYRWLEKIQDWCISRQLWWGHRIPAWYDETGEIYVGESEEAVRAHYHLADTLSLKQDEDVLDTWFSSALWPFSTLGWPAQTQEIQDFYPTSVLVTGFDIIFFWVARMIMFGLYFTQKIPFKAIYIHGLIRDSEGQKMSKSKGNGLDPVDLIDGIDLPSLIEKRTRGLMQESLKPRVTKSTEKQFPNGIQAYGTDALRFTFAAIASPSRDIHFDVKRLEGYRNFCNKLWNAARFLMMNLDSNASLQASSQATMDQGEALQSQAGTLSAAEYIHEHFESLFQTCIQSIHTQTQSGEATSALETYRFDLMAQNIYQFFWEEYCDWYLEFCKVILNNPLSSADEKSHTRFALFSMFEQILCLAHPIIPFITEEIWQSIKIPLALTEKSILDRPYPTPTPGTKVHSSGSLAQQQAFTPKLRALILEIRGIRSQHNIHPSTLLTLYYNSPCYGTEPWEIDPNWLKPFLFALGKVDAFIPLKADTDLSTAYQFNEYYLNGVINPEAEKERLAKEKRALEIELEQVRIKLSKPDFTEKAPPAIVEKEKMRQKNLQNRLDQLS